MTIAVIGLGSIGMRHALNLLKAGEDVLAYDPDTERCTMFEEQGGRTENKREIVLNNAEAAVICSPNPCHLDDMKEALANGCHVLVEKPFSHTLGGLQDVLEDADNKCLAVVAAMNLRYHPVTQKAKSLLCDKELGNVLWARFLCSAFLPDWRPHQDYRKGYTTDPVSGGVLFDLVHEIDLAQYLLGGGDVLASAARTTGVIETLAEDCADLILGHSNGVNSSLHLDYISRNAQRFFEIQCAGGFIKGDLIRRNITVTGVDGQIHFEKVFEGSYAEDYIAEMNSFLAFIRRREGVVCQGFEACEVLKTVIKARELAGMKNE